MSAETAELFCFDDLFCRLVDDHHEDWVQQLRSGCCEALRPDRHAQLATWLDLLRQIPDTSGACWHITNGHVTAPGYLPASERSALRSLLLRLRPWRKGPFDLLGIRIDSEWRSHLKWDRIASHAVWRNRRILDVGCGNGYFGWRMLAAGAATVVGLDPCLLYAVQHEAVRRCVGISVPNYLLPLSDACLQSQLCAFDVAVSMGVLYHRTSPIDHLQMLRESLRPAGQLILETLIVPDDDRIVLVPPDRYAKMRNVWFIPSPEMLTVWLQRTGFTDVRVVDITRTTSEEQRRTDWMTFESLPDFLDPFDAHRTIEGHPAPVRAVIAARRQD